MNPYLLMIIVLLPGSFLLDAVAELLNLGAHRPEPPAEFKDVLTGEQYRRSGEYLRESTRFDLLRRGFFLIVTLGFILAGGFNWLDGFARLVGGGAIVTGLVFVSVLTLARTLLQIPFSVYDTFVIEERYGFNRTTAATFAGDLLKGGVLGLLLGGLVFAGLIYFFGAAGPHAWFYAWVALSVFQIGVGFLAPVVIMPLFNRFKPVPDGPLKRAIEEYIERERFQIQGVYTMDGSKRSTKANAFFAGFGRFRRLVLFDTLIEKHTVDELMGVLAHEIGHFKRRHIVKSTVLGVLASGAMLFAASRFIGNRELFDAFGMEQVSIYASLIFISVVFSPLLRVLGIFTNLLSRKYEFEADAYSVNTYKKPEALVSALKKLSADNLSHLTPHPLKIWLDYSHPPVLRRIEALRHAGS